MARVQLILSYRVEPFPCHLGIPLSVHKLKRSEEQFLVDKVAKRIPSWKGSLLNAAGQAALVASTMSAIPVHTSIALGLSPWAINSIDKLRRSFIWSGSDSVSGARCKVAWTKVRMPKELGGLGTADLRRASVALRVCWVWRDRVAGHRSGTGAHGDGTFPGGHGAPPGQRQLNILLDRSLVAG